MAQRSPRRRPSAFEGQRPSLDRTSTEPAYSQLAGLLREKIAGGELRPGERIPSVPELSATFGVASMTVRQAVEQLTKEGAVVRERGRGTFVRPPNLSSATFDLEDLRRQMTGADLRVKVLGARSVRATPRVADKLGVQEGMRVISIKRLLVRDDEPLFYHSEYLIWDPRRPLVEAELSVTSLQGLFSGVGQIDIKNGHLVLHASTLFESEASHLGEQPGALAWVIEHLFYDFDDAPVSWGRFVCRADRLTFQTDVGIFDQGRPDRGERS
jgi:GntR family transcriptional regulator